MKIGLSLAGGGIKGVAHVGVLKAFEEKNIKVDMISGASSGSIVATLYAIGFRPSEIYEFFRRYAKDIKYVDGVNILKLVWGIVSGNGVTIKGLTRGIALKDLIQQKCKEKNIKFISDIKFPLYISCVDLCDGNVYVFSNSMGNYDNGIKLVREIEVSTAVRASCSYPGVFEPVSWNGVKLVDGGIRENIPWKVLKCAGADKVISVIFKDITKKNCCKNMISVIECSIGYLGNELQKYEVHGTDELIEISTKNVTLLDAKKVDELYNIGYMAGMGFLKNNSSFRY